MSDQGAKFAVARPPDYVFERAGADYTETLLYQPIPIKVGSRRPPATKEGQETLLLGFLYPKKGEVYPDAIADLARFKDDVMAWIRPMTTAAGKSMALLFLLMPWRWQLQMLDKVCESLARKGQVYLTRHFLGMEPNYSSPENLTSYWKPQVRQLKMFLERFLLHLGVNYWASKMLAKCLATFFEYDDQYFYRYLDAFAELKDPAWCRLHPILCVFRLVWTNNKRDLAVGWKFKLAGWLLIFLMVRRGRMRRAWSYAIGGVDLKRMHPDLGDAYHTLYREDYNYGGVPFDERWVFYCIMHRRATHDCAGRPTNGNLPPMLEPKSADEDNQKKE